MPVVTSSRSSGSRANTSAGNGVRSRIATMTSNGAKAAASASGRAMCSRNTVTSGCPGRLSQSALASAAF